MLTTEFSLHNNIFSIGYTKVLGYLGLGTSLPNAQFNTFNTKPKA